MSNAGQAILGGTGAIIGGILTGGALTGVILGAQIGLMLGSVLFPTKVETPDPTISDIKVTTSAYGAPLPVVLGSRTVSGNLIYYGNFQTIVEEEEEGGKGGGGVTTITVRYTVTLAIGVCLATEPTSVINVWAGSSLVSPSCYTAYDGTQTAANGTLSTVMAAEGKTRIPVWKNFCYIVLPDFDLGTNPNVPNFKIEVKSSKYNYTTTTAGKYIDAANTTYTWLEFSGTYLIGMRTSGTTYYYYLSKLDIDTYELIIDEVLIKGDTLLGATDTYTWIRGNQNPPDVHSVILLNTSDFSQIKMINLWAYSYYLPADGNAAYAIGNYLYCVLRQYLGGSSFQIVLVKVDGVLETVTQLCKLAEHGAAIWAGTFTHKGVTATRILVHPLYSTSLYIYSDTGTLIDTITGVVGTSNTPHSVDSDGVNVTIGVNGSVYFYSSLSPLTLETTVALPHSSGVTYATLFVPDDARVYTLHLNTGLSRYQISRYESGAPITGDDYDAIDLCPTTISREVLTNKLWGLGLDKDTYLNSTNYDATESYTWTNDLLVSMVFNSQSSVLDILQKIINHHNGFITYANGKISHRQLKTETPTAELTCPGDIVIKDNELPVTITRSGARDSYNKAVVEYTKRYDSASNEYYVTRTAIDSDMVDIAANGLKPETISLDGLTTYTRAAKMAGIMLLKSLLNPISLSFSLGPKSLGIKPGDVYELTYTDLELNALDIRISSISEKDDYTIEVEAQEENTGIYDLTYYGSDSTVTPLPPALFADATDVVNPVAVEIPAMYAYDKELIAVTYSKPDDIQWAGASLHRAYASGGSYTRLDTSYRSGVTGTVTAVAIAADIATITVELDWDFTLSSASSFDVLMATPRQNLCAFTGTYGTVFCRFSDATLVSGNTWTLSGLIYDTTGFPDLNTYGNIEADDVFVFYNNMPYIQELPISDMDRTLYYKIASFNFKGIEQSLADVTAISIAPEGLVSKPLAPYNAKVNGIGMPETETITAGSGDLEITWMSRNRRNEGGLNYAYADAVNDDYDFDEFVLQIYNDTTLMRTVNQATKTYTYTSALQSADGAVSPFTCRLYQKGLSDVSDAYEFIVTTV